MHTLVSKLVALSVEKYYMLLTTSHLVHDNMAAVFDVSMNVSVI